MRNSTQPIYWILAIILTGLGCSPPAAAKPAPGACVELGALAWNDWTSVDGGGSGEPRAEPYLDYVRCKSCHGWDRRGIKGGYVRRTRTAERPNAGLGDSDRTSRDIAPGMGDYYHIRDHEVLHAGTGRAYEDGSGSWVELGDNPTPADKAAYAAGYTLGNQHPDFSTSGVNGDDIVLTQEQVDCLVAFVNFGDSDPNFYWVYIDTDQYPAKYVINSAARAGPGKTFYDETCRTCHGDPVTDHNGRNNGQPEGGILAFLQGDGNYSEFVHKARWGIPDTIMTRSAMGRPDSQNMIDVMLYLQELVPTKFAITGGISGTWYDTERSGEGLLIDVAPMEDGSWKLVASYYTYDGMGNQVWLVGAGIVSGDRVTVEMQITEGGIFGSSFQKIDVVRTVWGTLEFQFTTCSTGQVWVVPSHETLASGQGFEIFDFFITRLTPADSCP